MTGNQSIEKRETMNLIQSQQKDTGTCFTYIYSPLSAPFYLKNAVCQGPRAGPFWTSFGTSCLAIGILLFLRKLWLRRKDESDSAQHERKREFLRRAGEAYGYPRSQKGFIDSWRTKEFPNLIAPLGQTSTEKAMVYLDYAGAALPSKSQLMAVYADTSAVLANPHSTGPAAAETLLRIDQATKRVMEFLDCSPGRLSGLDGVEEDSIEANPGYDVVFVSGATQALQIVAERFPWSSCTYCGRVSQLVYAHNSHTSVVGMRGPALTQGGTFSCKSLHDIINHPEETLFRSQHPECSCKVSSLLVVSAECNFGGARPKLRYTLDQCRRNRRWFTMLDIAKAVSTSRVSLREWNTDFACLSFYKLFGTPTGLGALLCRRTATPILTTNTNHYFGGGSVDMVLPNARLHVPRQQQIGASLTHGTAHFRGIASLIHGFYELDCLGGIEKIDRHTRILTEELVRRLRRLSHNNGHPLVVLYGAWANDEIESDRGPTVAFNCVRADGSVVGYNEVAKLAELTQPPLQLRTGCFCNPGACQEALELSDEDVQENYYSRGHVCGDQIDVIDGRPTGAVRVSLGKDNIWEDVDRLICFLEKTFVSRSVALKEISEGPTSTKARITELYLFPIKSCAAQRVKVWPLDTTSGRVLWDREFALVDSFGTAMRLQRYPKMAQIRPTIDLEESTMTVTAPGCKDLVLSLRDEGGVKPNGSIQVCGSKCGGQLWGNWETSNWFSNFLGVECWLARYKDSREGQASVPQVAFANEKPILLISENEVNRLNILLEKQGLEKVKTRHFRPNVVVTTNIGVSEYSWSTLSLGNRVQYSTSGECARCSMVDIDPETSSKGNTLCSLAQYRRTNGSITFGVFLRLAGTSIKEDAALSEGDILYCE